MSQHSGAISADLKFDGKLTKLTLCDCKCDRTMATLLSSGAPGAQRSNPAHGARRGAKPDKPILRPLGRALRLRNHKKDPVDLFCAEQVSDSEPDAREEFFLSS